MLHGKKRKFKPDHAADLARPQPAGIDHMVGLDCASLGDDVPGSVRFLGEFNDTVAQHDFGAKFLGGLGIGMGGARRVEMTFDGIPERTDKIALVHQREHGLGFGRGDQLGFHAEIAALGVDQAEEIHPLGRIGHHHAAGQMQAAGLARELFKLFIQAHCVGLQFGDVGVAVERVKAAGCMPGGTGCELRAFYQHDIAPAGLRQMVKHGTANDAATDDHGSHM